jgi:hypothetical protein
MGTGVRFGSVVGFAQIGGEEAMALGAQVAVGHRLGRAMLELELDALELTEVADPHPGAQEQRRGDMQRVGLTARVDVARVPVGPRSLWMFFVETGAGHQRSAWDGGEHEGRPDTHIGMGWLLDHRGRRQQLLPAVGWHVGWRLTAARSDEAAHMRRALCRGKDCVAPPMQHDLDTGLLVSSSLQISW